MVIELTVLRLVILDALKGFRKGRRRKGKGRRRKGKGRRRKWKWRRRKGQGRWRKGKGRRREEEDREGEEEEREEDSRMGIWKIEYICTNNITIKTAIVIISLTVQFC